MTITRICQTGFELGSTTAEIPITINGLAVDTTAPKTGNYAMSVGFNQSGYWTFTATNQMRYGFHFRYPGVDFASRFVSAIRDGSGNVLASIRVSADYSGVGFFVGAGQVGSYYPTNPTTYYHYGIDVKKDASAGWWAFYVDGVLWASQSGNTSATQIGGITLGMYGGSNYAGTSRGYFDNLLIDNTTGEATYAPVPDRRFIYIAPNGDGNYSQMMGSDGNQVNNFVLVDERPPSGADYVYASGVDLTDSYALGDYAPSPGSRIVAVIPFSLAAKSSSADIEIALGTRVSSTDLIGTGQNLPTSYGYWQFERQTEKPGGGDWTESDVDSAEFVMRSSGSYT